MVGLDFAGLDHVLMVAESVKQLRAIALRVYGVKFYLLHKGLPQRSVGLGVHIHPFVADPYSGKPPQRAKIFQGIDVEIRGFRINVFVIRAHDRPRF